MPNRADKQAQREEEVDGFVLVDGNESDDLDEWLIYEDERPLAARAPPKTIKKKVTFADENHHKSHPNQPKLKVQHNETSLGDNRKERKQAALWESNHSSDGHGSSSTTQKPLPSFDADLWTSPQQNEEVTNFARRSINRQPQRSAIHLQRTVCQKQNERQ